MDVYILKLTDGCYYVGRARNVKPVIRDHFKGLGCKWTRIHKPIGIYAIIHDCIAADENKYTIDMMQKCVWQTGLAKSCLRVRGGSYRRVHLDDTALLGIRRKLCRMARPRAVSISSHLSCFCTKCGRRGHTERVCIDAQLQSRTLIYNCDNCDKRFSNEGAYAQHSCRCSIM